MSQVPTPDPHLLEQLPTLPGSAVAFVKICDDPRVGVAEVAEVAQTDPALVARILQVANSPYYSPREPVHDVVRAAAILGLRSLKMIGVGFAIVGDLWSSATNSKELVQVIGASAMAGSGARSFSARIGTGRDEEALTAGLLSFVGELALLKCFPARMAALWADHGGPPPGPVVADEFGADGVTLGEMLMERWSIPVDLRAGVQSRRSPPARRMARRTEVYSASLGFGTSIAELMLTGDHSITSLREPARAWGFTDEELMRFWAEFRVAVRHTTRQLELNVSSELDAMIVEAKEEYLRSPVHAATELDAARREIDELKAENARLEGLSLRDPLTDVPNRAAFDAALRGAIAAHARSPETAPVAVALFDLDRFKSINDTQGHLLGDRLLCEVAGAAARAARVDELFARLGGDEFALVLRSASADELAAGVERIRAVMNEAAASLRSASGVTVSAGAAILDDHSGAIDDRARRVIGAADDALYAAKRAGRNRASVAAIRHLALAVDTGETIAEAG